MKTFVVEHVLCDYGCGLIVVKAKDKSEAVELICKEWESERKEIEENIRELGNREVVYVGGGE